MNFYKKKGFKYVLNLCFGAGAAVVMLGALAKLNHTDILGLSGDLLIAVGLTTEAVLFTIQGILPPAADYHWERLYPGLDRIGKAQISGGASIGVGGGSSLTQKLDSALDEANVDALSIDRLGSNLQSLNENISKMNDVTDLAVSHSEYSTNVKDASDQLAKVKDAYSETAASMSTMSSALGGTKEYLEQVQEVTRHLTSLNKIYDVELKDTNSHIKSLRQYYGTMNEAMKNMSETAEDVKNYKQEMGKLRQQLAELNNAYGRMLNAMGAAQ